MASNTGFYSFDKVIATFGGVPLTGFAEGDDAITIRRRAPTHDVKVGAGGDTVVNQMADRTGEIIIKLLQTSPSNAVLAAILTAAEKGSPKIALPFMVVDRLNGGELAMAPLCVVSGHADKPFGANQNGREWTLIATHLEMAS